MLKRFALMLLFSVLALTACAGQQPADDTPVETPTPTPTPAAVDPNNVSPNIASETIYKFNLFPIERTLYDSYVENNDLSVFKDVSLISIAKIFIQCGLDDNIDAEYALYHPDTTTHTLEEYIELNTTEGRAVALQDRLTFADIYFGNIDGAEVKHVTENTASVNFKSQAGENVSLVFRKSDDGIWLMEYDQF
jgi:hypothetical protein